MRNHLLSFFFLIIAFSGCKNVPDTIANTNSAQKAVSILHHSTQTLVSAHRGGSGLINYPENALETLQYLHSKGIQIFEIDVFGTSDNQLMLLHDSSLERTTTGNGTAKDKSSKKLLGFNLVDDFGNETSYKIPFLKDVLNWAKNEGAVLMIDFKKSARYKDVIELIKQTDTEDNCVLISYNVQQAKKLHRLAPNMLLSVSTRNEKELDWILETNIPTEQMIGFTGTKLSSENLYKRLNELKIPAILGTLGNLDHRAAARKDNMYKKWADLGIQIIATDRAIEAYNALK